MEETLSWQAQLAKSNINITSLQFSKEHTACTVCYEFPYHPKPGQVKWLKSACECVSGEDGKTLFLPSVAKMLLKVVLSLRKELEG